MILSVLCYLLGGIVLAFFGKQASIKCQRLEKISNHKLLYNEHIGLILLLFFLFFGLRSFTTGVDTQSYVKIYEYFGKFGHHYRDSMELGFKWLTEVYSTIGVPIWIFLGTFGILQLYFVIRSIRNQYFLYPYIFAYIILGPIFLNWANGMRQCLVSCVFLFAIQYIEERKIAKYVIVILLCTLMHKSALILIPFFWILKFDFYPPNKYLRIGFLIVSVLIGQSSSWVSNIAVISDGLVMLGYDSYSENIEYFIEEQHELALGPNRISMLIASACVIWKTPDIIHELCLPKRYNMYFSLYFLGTCSFNIFANTSHIFLRPIEYLTITGIILVPLLLYYLVKRKYLLVSLIYGFLIYWYSTYVSVKAYVGGLGSEDPSVYSFSFLQ